MYCKLIVLGIFLAINAVPAKDIGVHDDPSDVVLTEYFHTECLEEEHLEKMFEEHVSCLNKEFMDDMEYMTNTNNNSFDLFACKHESMLLNCLDETEGDIRKCVKDEHIEFVDIALNIVKSLAKLLCSKTSTEREALEEQHLKCFENVFSEVEKCLKQADEANDNKNKTIINKLLANNDCGCQVFSGMEDCVRKLTTPELAEAVHPLFEHMKKTAFVGSGSCITNEV